MKKSGCLFDIDCLKSEVSKLEKETSDPDFWSDNDKAQVVLQDIKQKKDKITEYEAVEEASEELDFTLELLGEMEDEEIYSELKKKSKALEKEVDELMIDTLLDGDYDSNSAILSIHAGAGGLEAQDWSEMLLRMYTRWAEGKGYTVKTIDLQSDTAGGIKSVTLSIDGFNAYGYLKGEKGVHRLVRISPFDSSGRRHTSFASVDVFPKLDEDVEVDINQSDLKIDTYRASGAGGQHVNTTDSAIRITHLPTGIVVQCQNERSQHSNKATAMRLLMSKLIELKESERKEEIDELHGDYSQIAWGSQIRSYVFHPYNLVKDHRTDAEMGNTSAVMDGDIDLFINEYLKKN